MPVTNQTANLEIFPSHPSINLFQWGSTGTYFSGPDGVLSICPILLAVSSSGIFPLRITSNGGGNLSTFLVFKQATTLSRTKLMEYLTIGLLVFFSSMLMASVPHSNALFEIAGTALSTGLTIFASISYTDIPQSPYYRGYFVFLVIGLGLVSLASAALLAINFASKYHHSLRRLNGEGKAELMYNYVSWIVNITAEKQQRLAGPSKVSTDDHELQDLGCKDEDKPPTGVTDDAADGLDRLTERDGEEDIAASLLKSNLRQVRSSLQKVLIQKKPTRRLVRRALRPTLVYDRPDLEPTYVPFGFYIVVAFTAVLMVSVGFIVLFLHNQIDYYFHKLIIFLPATNENARISQANSQIVNVLCTGIALVVEKFPELGALMNLVPRLHSFNVVVYLSDLRDNLSAIILGIELLFIIAGSVSLLTVIAALAVTYQKIPKLIVGIRRGQIKLLPEAMKVTPVEGQIGQHVMLLVILQQLTFWFIVLFGLIIALPAVRGFIADNYLVLGITFGTSFVSQFLTEKVIVERFLSERNFVVLPEIYAVWHFVALILGIFTGIVSGIVRWATAVGVLTFTFASVELSVMPSAFSGLDKAHIGFLCSVQTEATNGNPIMLVFASLLITTKELRALAVENSRSEHPTVTVDELFTSRSSRTSSAVVNLCRLIGRAKASSQNVLDLSVPAIIPQLPLSPYVEDVALRRHSRVQQRFWLFWILWRNPSLRDERKHRLEYMIE